MFSFYNTPRRDRSWSSRVLRSRASRSSGQPRSSTCRCSCARPRTGFVPPSSTATDLFDRATIERMGRHLASAARGGRRRIRISRAATLTSSTTRSDTELLVEWNATRAPPPSGRRRRADLGAGGCTPGADRRRGGREELDLRRAGAAVEPARTPSAAARHRPDHLVGLCVARTTDLLVAVLGILKAGAGYVPLDPAYPPDRLAFMLARFERLGRRDPGGAPVRLPRDRSAGGLPGS